MRHIFNTDSLSWRYFSPSETAATLNEYRLNVMRIRDIIPYILQTIPMLQNSSHTNSRTCSDNITREFYRFAIPSVIGQKAPRYAERVEFSMIGITPRGGIIIIENHKKHAALEHNFSFTFTQFPLSLSELSDRNWELARKASAVVLVLELLVSRGALVSLQATANKRCWFRDDLSQRKLNKVVALWNVSPLLHAIDAVIN